MSWAQIASKKHRVCSRERVETHAAVGGATSMSWAQIASKLKFQDSEISTF
jgi:hypothetical protein